MNNHTEPLPEDAKTELYVRLLTHTKASMAETAVYLARGESVTEIAKRRTCLGGDARAVENVVLGYLRHDAATWVRRTARLARALQLHDDLGPATRWNVEAILTEVALRELVG